MCEDHSLVQYSPGNLTLAYLHIPDNSHSRYSHNCILLHWLRCMDMTAPWWSYSVYDYFSLWLISPQLLKLLCSCTSRFQYLANALYNSTFTTRFIYLRYSWNVCISLQMRDDFLKNRFDEYMIEISLEKLLGLALLDLLRLAKELELKADWIKNQDPERYVHWKNVDCTCAPWFVNVNFFFEKYV